MQERKLLLLYMYEFPLVFFFLTMQIENLLNQNGNTFISEHINQTTKNIIELHNIQVNSKRKRFKAYTRDNLNIPRIPKIQDIIKHIDEQGFKVTYLSN